MRNAWHREAEHAEEILRILTHQDTSTQSSCE
jgi:hypothetical protein